MTMPTCPKCFKQNPSDAVFCGFCGAKMVAAEPEGGARTVFGYALDATKLAGAQEAMGGEPAAAPGPAAPPPQSPAPAPQPASVVAQPGGRDVVANKYQLDDLARRLPAGELFPARDVNNQGEVELLLVDKAVFHSPLDMERARRELRQLQKVECSAIVKVHDHGKTEEERLFVVMERVSGTSLDQIVSQGPLNLADAQRVVKGVGTGLAEAQKMGVIHRDIAPHNVLICTDGTIKVRGFGIAPPVKRHVFGTPAFISPEQAAGRPVDQRSNIYSLGALVFYMLTGEPPFVGETVDEVLTKHQKEEPVSPRVRRPDLDLPPRAEALIMKALAKSSSRRHLTLRQFLREVESLAAVTGPQEPVREEAPLSFETPLHGVTALKSGTEPPPSSEPKLEAIEEDAISLTVSDTGTDNAPLSAPTVPAGLPAPGQMAPTLMDPRRQDAAAPGPEMPAPAMAGPAAEPAPEPGAPEQPGGRKRPTQITGELSSDVKLRPADEATPLTERKTEPPKAATAPPAEPPAAAPSAPAAAPGQKPAFRETMWFFKGEVESAMAAEGSEEVAKPEDVEASPEELSAKYADDGSLSDEAARRLSLRTGKTQMMQQVGVPSGEVPGEKMAPEDLLDEINRKRRIVAWTVVFVVLAAIGGVVAWLVVQ
jgi:serine/threonine protein kinase